MCGICGQLSYATDTPVERETIVRMAQSIRHRGPDDEGFFVSGQIGLGFRRLSIIDLAGGHQPMSDASRRYWLAYNGEVYNFRQLKADLTKRHGAIPWRSGSDTEVIVEGFAREGFPFLSRLNGIFALAKIGRAHV